MLKRSLVLVLAVCLLLGGCVSREPAVISVLEDRDSSDSQQQPDVDDSPSEPEEPLPVAAIDDPEQVSEIKSIVTTLLDQAKKCDIIFTGSIPINEDAPSQYLEDPDVEYFYVDSQTYNSPAAIERLWENTFQLEGSALEAYEKMVSDKLYVSINGELFVKEVSDRPPLTMGMWNTDNLVVTLLEDDTIKVVMDTTLIGKANGNKELTLVGVDDIWVLTESYFLD